MHIREMPHRQNGTRFDPTDELTAELQTHVRGTTAPYKYPRIVEYVPELPKTANGKIRRAQLRES